MQITIRPSSSWMRRSVSMTIWAFIGSSEAMGSSARMMRGSLHERPGDGHALLLAARQGFGALRRLLGDAEAVEDLDRRMDIGLRVEVEHRRQRRAADSACRAAHSRPRPCGGRG